MAPQSRILTVVPGAVILCFPSSPSGKCHHHADIGYLAIPLV